ncbi:MAG: choice-of-anchor D domain-containing protein [Candidatus Acidiferrales bacterium]
MKTHSNHDAIARIARRGLVLAALFALVLSAAGVSRAQSKPAPVGPTAARSSRAVRPEIPVGAQSVVSATLGNADRGYRAKASATGYTTENPANHLAAQYGANGVEITLQNANLDMEFQSWGYGERRVNENRAANAPLADANRVEYRRGALTEWYVNGPLGIEQGFTISQPPVTPPDSRNDALDIALRLRGNLSASIEPGRHSLALRGQDGVQALRYGPLLAYDASGRELESWIEEEGSLLRLRVNTVGARYPVVVDPFVQVAQLSVSGGIGLFGYATAISGDGTVVVAGGCDSVSGIGGCTTTLPGQAYVFVEPTTGGWAAMTSAPTVTLTASGGTTGTGGPNAFGTAVAISGDGKTILVGASEQQCETYPGLECTGDVYVFTAASESAWATISSQQAPAPIAVLTPSVPILGDFFGGLIATNYDGSTIVAREYDPTNGVAHLNLYIRPSSGWANTTEDVQLQSDDVAPYDNFGSGMGISGFDLTNSSNQYRGTVVAGAFLADSSNGEAYVFLEPTAGWSSLNPSNPGPPATPTVAIETVKLLASGAATNHGQGGFGYATAVDEEGDTVVVGDPFQNSDIGEAYVFLRPPGGWDTGTTGGTPQGGNPQYETTQLLPSDYTSITVDSVFGQNVSISNDGSTISVGSDYDGVYLFTEPSSAWPSGTIGSSTTPGNPVKLTPTVTSVSGSDTAEYGQVSGDAVASGTPGTVLVSVPGNNSGAGAVFVYGTQASEPYAQYTNSCSQCNSGGPLDFGAVDVNTTGTQTVTLTNPPGSSAFNFTGVSLQQGTSFSITKVVCSNGNTFTTGFSSISVTLAVGDSCTITLQFAPLVNENGYGDLLVIGTTITNSNPPAAPNSNASAAPPGTVGQAMLLVGDGVAPYAFFSNTTAGSPSQVTFGNVLENTPATQTLTLANTGDGPLVIQGARIAPGGGFGFEEQIVCGSVAQQLTLPLTINAGSFCAFTVQFDPTSLGPLSNMFGFLDNAGVGETNVTNTADGASFQQNVSLSGTGISSIATTTTITSTSSSFDGFPLPPPFALVSSSSEPAPVTVNVTVALASGSTTPIPTGTVIVEDGFGEFCQQAVTLTSANNGKGSCTLLINQLGSGSTPLYAQYTPDAASNASGLLGSNTNTNPTSFTEDLLQITNCGTPASAQSSTQGMTTIFTITACLAGDVNALPTAVVNDCPPNASCSVTATPVQGQPGVYTVVLTIVPGGAGRGAPREDRRPWGEPWPLTLFAFGILLTMLMALQLARKNRARPRLAYGAGFVIALALMLGGLNGCAKLGNSNTLNGRTPDNTYIVHVTITAGKFSVIVPFTLIVTN